MGRALVGVALVGVALAEESFIALLDVAIDGVLAVGVAVGVAVALSWSLCTVMLAINLIILMSPAMEGA